MSQSFLLPLLLVVVLASGITTHARAESTSAADALNKISEGLNVAGATASQVGKSQAGKALGRFGNVATLGEAAVHTKNGSLPDLVGSLVEGGVGIVTIPSGAAAGTSVMPGAGTVAGGYVGSRIAAHAGSQAKKLTQETLDKFSDPRTPAQKRRQDRMMAAGLDRNEFATSYDKPLSGNMAEFEADLARELMRLEAEKARHRGASYYPDPALMEEIAELDRISKETSDLYGKPITESGQSPETVKEEADTTDLEEEGEDAEQVEDSLDQADLSPGKDCPPELVQELENGIHERFYADAGVSDYAIENLAESLSELQACYKTDFGYTIASEVIWARNNCIEAGEITVNHYIELEQKELDRLSKEIELNNECKFLSRPIVSLAGVDKNEDSPVGSTEYNKIEPPKADKFIGGKESALFNGNSSKMDRKWIFKPPKIWVDPK